jgi:hypothetical protein
MTIWILAVILFGIVGALGRQVGGLRMCISLVGVIVAMFAAGPLSPFVRQLLETVGTKNPITVWMLSAPLAFLGILLAFNSAAVAVWIKVSGYYRFRATDDIRMRWERLEAGTGLAAGVAAAVVYLVAASAYVYHVAYYTRQLESPTDNPLWVKLVNKMGEDLSSSGFDRVATGLGRPGPTFFQTADTLGMLYHNGDLQARLADYPLFTSLTEVPDLQGILTNEAYAVMLPAQTNISLLLKDPNSSQLFNHPEIQRVVRDVDLPDLLKFFETGVSEKYAKEPLVGKWQFDINTTIRQFAAANPKVTVANQNRIKALLKFRMSDYQLISTPDQKIFVKGSQKPLSNFNGLLGTLFTVPVQAPGAKTNAPLQTVAQGSWKLEGDKYQVTIQTEGAEKTVDVQPDKGRLTVPVGNNTLVFTKVN